MLILNGVEFSLRTEEKEASFLRTCFYILESDDDTIEISLDGAFNENSLEGINIKPSFALNSFETNKTKISELIGMVFKVDTINESLDREDTFYVWEHEPFEKLKLEIVDIDTKEGKVHVKCEGIAVIDGYSEPFKTATFMLDCWVPVINWDEAIKTFGI